MTVEELIEELQKFEPTRIVIFHGACENYVGISFLRSFTTHTEAGVLMTVRELIEELRTYDPNLPVQLKNEQGQWVDPIVKSMNHTHLQNGHYVIKYVVSLQGNRL